MYRPRKRMSQTGQLCANIEVNAPAAMIHEVFTCRPNYLSSVCPDKVQSVDLLDGEWGKAGSVICWHYSHDGKAQISKEVMEEIDYENKKTTYHVIEGSLLEIYKSFYFVLQATPKGEGSLVNWTLKYEKLNENVPEPNALLQLGIDATIVVAANLNPQA